jgi:hypothetical protein
LIEDGNEDGSVNLAEYVLGYSRGSGDSGALRRETSMVVGWLRLTTVVRTPALCCRLWQRNVDRADPGVPGPSMWAGAADVARATNDTTLLNAMETIWANVVDKKMYVTGGFDTTPRARTLSPRYTGHTPHVQLPADRRASHEA